MKPPAGYVPIREFCNATGAPHSSVLYSIKTGKVRNFWRNGKGWVFLDPTTAAADMGLKQIPDRIAAMKPRSEGPEPSDTSPLAVVKLQHEKIKVQRAALELQKFQGTLVEKDKVYKELFLFGQELRQNLLLIPARIIDDILATRSRTAALETMLSEIERVLEVLSDYENNK